MIIIFVRNMLTQPKIFMYDKQFQAVLKVIKVSPLTKLWIPAKLRGISTHQPWGAQRRANSIHLGCGWIRSVAK
jgi:hypothetical protein